MARYINDAHFEPKRNARGRAYSWLHVCHLSRTKRREYICCFVTLTCGLTNGTRRASCLAIVSSLGGEVNDSSPRNRSNRETNFSLEWIKTEPRASGKDGARRDDHQFNIRATIIIADVSSTFRDTVAFLASNVASDGEENCLPRRAAKENEVKQD